MTRASAAYDGFPRYVRAKSFSLVIVSLCWQMDGGGANIQPTAAPSLHRGYRQCFSLAPANATGEIRCHT